MYRRYEDLKHAVMTGKELISRAEPTDCPGPSWDDFGIAKFVAGWKIFSARLEKEGKNHKYPTNIVVI